MSEEVPLLLEVLKLLNLGALIPSSFTVALLWKLYGFFNELSEKLTRIETKLDGIKELLPYKIKEAMEQIKDLEKKSKKKKHNPALGIIDVLEVVGVGLGISDLFIFFLIFLLAPTLIYNPLLWGLFFIPGLLGILPVIISEEKLPKNRRVILSLISVIPWIYLTIILGGA